MKTTRSFRLSSELLKKCNKMNLNLNSLIESHLQKIVNDKKCPVCNQKIEEKAFIKIIEK